MNRVLAIAVVACVILFIVVIFTSPMVDLEPTALRAQQWLSFMVAMFSLAALLVLCFFEPSATAEFQECLIPDQVPIPPADRSCCLLC
jgi:hypothetical protein